MDRIVDAGRQVLVASPSDLVSLLACAHTTTLDLEVAMGRRDAPVDNDPDSEVLRRRGGEHERSYLASLVAAGLTVADGEAAAADDDGVLIDPLTGDGPSVPSPARGWRDQLPLDDVRVDGTTRLEQLRAQADVTRRAIEGGVDVIYQATFLDEADPDLWWRGTPTSSAGRPRPTPTPGTPPTSRRTPSWLGR